MASSEGSQAIAAAKKRLAAAEAQKISALKNIGTADVLANSASQMTKAAESMAATAKKNKWEAESMRIAAEEMAKSATKTKTEADSMKKSAQDMADASKRQKDEAQALFNSSATEAENAEAFLKAMEKKYEVIDVDADEEPSRKNENANKKRKALSSVPSVTASSNNENSSAAANSATGETFRPSASAGRGLEIILQNARAGRVNKIIVEDCGLSALSKCGCPEVIGIYARDNANTEGNTATFTKEGQWKTRRVKFTIFYEMSISHWFIGAWSDHSLPLASTNGEDEEVIIDDDSEEDDDDDDDFCVGNGLDQGRGNLLADQTVQLSYDNNRTTGRRRSKYAKNGMFHGGMIEKLYRTISASEPSEIPPMEAGWMSVGDGISPAPKLYF